MLIVELKSVLMSNPDQEWPQSSTGLMEVVWESMRPCGQEEKRMKDHSKIGRLLCAK